jgi:hypothetical protein
MTKREDESSLDAEPLTRPEQMLALMLSRGLVPVSELAKLFDGTDDPVKNVYNNVPRVNERLAGKGKRMRFAPAYQLEDVEEEDKTDEPKRKRRPGRPQKSRK